MLYKKLRFNFLHYSACVLIMLSFLLQELEAVPAYRQPITVIQPDGNRITFMLQGDEFFHYKITTDGYLLTESNNGLLNYAQVDANGNVIDTQIHANEVSARSINEKKFLQTLTPNPEMTLVKKAYNTQRSIQSVVGSTGIQKAFPLNGKPKSLVILVNFSDKSFVTSNALTAYTNLLNQTGYSGNGGTGSARDYFRDNSFGNFDPQFDVVGPYTLPNNMAYYGGNVSGSDKNPRQMVIDACALADAAGVDFAQYDTDNDGIVDNIFIYYAGFNEAEGASANTIWPHRWALANTSTQFDNKIIYDYACTSELKGTSGTSMCGVGTFCHEFGHVLGLPDLYATNSATHHTLYSWDVMDYGPYNNSGRTPPSYSGYERFFLGWLTPTEIKTPQNLTLDTLSTSNKAYLLSQSGNHNLNGSNPSPVEFFMLENRQMKGWDTYLPGHGLLVTHVYYNSSTWDGNTVNNTPVSMGVDIVEADGTSTDASCSGDVFPGILSVKTYAPTLRAGTDITKPLTEITETNGIISFKLMGGTFPTIVGPVATTATNITQTTATLNWNILLFASAYLVDVYQLIDGQKVYIAGYQNKNVGAVSSLGISNLSPGITYYYVVRGTDGTNVTVNSNEISATTLVYTLNLFKATALEATDVTKTSFTARWKWNTNLILPKSYYLTVYEKSAGTAIEYNTLGFNGSIIPAGWTTSTTSFYTTSGYFGATSPSVYFTTEGGYLQTEVYNRKIRSIEFWYRGRSAAETNSLSIYSSVNGTSWQLLKTIQPLVTTSGQTITIPEAEIPESNSLKFVYSKPGTGYLAVDDIKIGLQDITNVPLTDYNNINVGNVNEYQVINLNKDTKYYYIIVAADQAVSTESSNEVAVQTSSSGTYTSIQDMKASYNLCTTGDDLFIYSGSQSTHLQVYNLFAKKLVDKVFNESLHLSKIQLPSGIYIIKINNETLKFLW